MVVQSDRVPLSTLLVAPTSTRSLLTSFRAEVDIGGTTTLVMVEQAVAVAPARLGPVVGHLTRAEMDEVDRALRTVLELG